MRVYMSADDCGTTVLMDVRGMDTVQISMEGQNLDIECELGSMCVVAVYCRYGDEIEPYLGWIRKVLGGCEGKAMIIGMDANAVSPLRYSKYVRTGRESERRDRELEELIGELDLEVLNRPSDLFTFSGPMGESGIDVTVVNGGWLERFVCDTWKVKENWGVSDHNCILIGVESVRGKFKEKIKRGEGGSWEPSTGRCSNQNWGGKPI
ncbi:hypothetical protein Zmor_028140 [Zophobas morio]|uniref:Endonuclease/exonuclease/phosphatase domain-containing protein n=1 Tax=Zophobas morio TaxID=2755281 RepID=A0AA38M3M2_9CUCU|nr:hypothetical protein Zmor_028140 [Zophobas morio]